MDRPAEVDGSAESTVEQAAQRATILGLSVSKKALTWTIVATVIAGIGVIATLFHDGDDQVATNENGIVIQGKGNAVNQYRNEIHNFIGDLSQARDSAQDIREAAKKYERYDPKGDGPWPFVVVADPNLGLKVRDSGIMQGTQVGSVGFKVSIWVDCKSDTGFDPEPDDPNGSVWYRVRWPNNQATEKYFNSSPADQFRQWVYGGLIVPVGHNGSVPACQ